MHRTQLGPCALNVRTNISRMHGPKSRLIRALLYTYTNKIELEHGLLCQCVARSIRQSIRPCTDCLSTNQIKEFVAYFNQYAIKYDTDHLFQLLQKIIHFSNSYCSGIGNCQNCIKFLSCFIFGHLNTGQTIRKH